MESFRTVKAVNYCSKNLDACGNPDIPKTRGLHDSKAYHKQFSMLCIRAWKKIICKTKRNNIRHLQAALKIW